MATPVMVLTGVSTGYCLGNVLLIRTFRNTKTTEYIQLVVEIVL